MSGAIERAVRLYWDANVFIRLVEGNDPVSDQLGRLLAYALVEGHVSIHSSALTLAETLVHPLRKNDRELLDTYRDFFDPNGSLEIAEVDRSILEEAAKIRSQLEALKLPDAIHIATARKLDCTHFVTGDKRLAVGTSLRCIDLTLPGLRSLTEEIDDRRNSPFG